MEIHKVFSFVGNLRKLHEEDEHPIENFTASIQCRKDGSIFLEIDSPTNEKLNHKKFYESAPIYGLKGSPQFTSEEMADPFFCLRLDELEQELIQSPYEGEYIIEGKTFEGWTVKAEIGDPNFSISFGSKNPQADGEHPKTYPVRLNDLCVDYHPHLADSTKLEVSYGFANLALSHNFSTCFLDSKYELNLISLTSSTNKNSRLLSALMTIKVLDQDAEEISYSTYFAWFELLISFATGKCLKQIYKVENNQSKGEVKKVELWSGSLITKESNGIAAMQHPHLHLFIQQCASEVTPDNFKEKGLGSALRWYVESFDSTTISVQFLLLCTVLETLNKHHSSQDSSKLITTSIYRKIRNEVLSIIDKYKKDFESEEDIGKFEIFRRKLEASFSGFNKLGSLRSNLEKMLGSYQVPYRDLFPELEFIKIRDNIVHQGFGGDNISVELRNLGNLVVRLFLSILKYKGDYIESRKIEIQDETGSTKHGLVYKSFPFKDRD